MSVVQHLNKYRYVTSAAKDINWPAIRAVNVATMRTAPPDLELVKKLTSDLCDCKLDSIPTASAIEVIQFVAIVQSMLQFQLHSQQVLKDQLAAKQNAETVNKLASQQIAALEGRIHALQKKLDDAHEEKAAMQGTMTSLEKALLESTTRLSCLARELDSEKHRNEELMRMASSSTAAAAAVAANKKPVPGRGANHHRCRKHRDVNVDGEVGGDDASSATSYGELVPPSHTQDEREAEEQQPAKTSRRKRSSSRERRQQQQQSQQQAPPFVDWASMAMLMAAQQQQPRPGYYAPPPPHQMYPHGAQPAYPQQQQPMYDNVGANAPEQQQPPQAQPSQDQQQQPLYPTHRPPTPTAGGSDAAPQKQSGVSKSATSDSDNNAAQKTSAPQQSAQGDAPLSVSALENTLTKFSTSLRKELDTQRTESDAKATENFQRVENMVSTRLQHMNAKQTELVDRLGAMESAVSGLTSDMKTVKSSSGGGGGGRGGSSAATNNNNNTTPAGGQKIGNATNNRFDDTRDDGSDSSLLDQKKADLPPLTLGGLRKSPSVGSAAALDPDFGEKVHSVSPSPLMSASRNATPSNVFKPGTNVNAPISTGGGGGGGGVSGADRFSQASSIERDPATDDVIVASRDPSEDNKSDVSGGGGGGGGSLKEAVDAGGNANKGTNKSSAVASGAGSHNGGDSPRVPGGSFNNSTSASPTASAPNKKTSGTFSNNNDGPSRLNESSILNESENASRTLPRKESELAKAQRELQELLAEQEAAEREEEEKRRSLDASGVTAEGDD